MKQDAEILADPVITGFIEQAERFLMLVSLTALLIGGLGVSGAVRAWLQSRMTVIATLKCVGATSNLIFRVYMLQVLAMAGLGIAGGLVLAGLTPFATTRLFADYVNVPLDPTFYPQPLAIAAAFGFLTTLVFALSLLLAGRRILFWAQLSSAALVC